MNLITYQESPMICDEFTHKMCVISVVGRLVSTALQNNSDYLHINSSLSSRGKDIFKSNEVTKSVENRASN